MNARLLHDIAEAADLLSITPRSLERLIRSGDLGSVKLGRRRLVPHEALIEYIARLRKAS